MKILILVDELYEDLELWYPKLRLEEEEYETIIAGEQMGKIYNGKHGYPCKAEVSISEIEESFFDALVIPGGFAPDKLRRNPKVLSLVKEFNTNKKCIAFICHAGWVAISAKILQGRKATSVAAIKDDMKNAGAIWEDKEVVVDHNLISSRSVSDLPFFARAIVEHLNTI